MERNCIFQFICVAHKRQLRRAPTSLVRMCILSHTRFVETCPQYCINFYFPKLIKPFLVHSNTLYDNNYFLPSPQANFGDVTKMPLQYVNILATHSHLEYQRYVVYLCYCASAQLRKASRSLHQLKFRCSTLSCHLVQTLSP